MAMLEVKNLGISFGGLRAVDGLDMTIEKGELYGLKSRSADACSPDHESSLQYADRCLQTDRRRDQAGW